MESFGRRWEVCLAIARCGISGLMLLFRCVKGAPDLKAALSVTYITVSINGAHVFPEILELAFVFSLHTIQNSQRSGRGIAREQIAGYLLWYLGLVA
ncbi:hypothetical protein B0T16DRAFT_201112 [Cercophora newfieldiana]|uniref:Uncharacterized protein n=1 Tax=Cercophora newfieldiana TaxID=92897 RepID=A0AA39XX48_9PEZI|nr:hypothetical protein B0T16DRAFT_201112 [Cercophora newfieldiana]